MAKPDATKKNQEPSVPPPNKDAIPVPLETQQRMTPVVPTEAQVKAGFPLVVRDIAGEFTIHFKTFEARAAAQLELIKRVTGLTPIDCVEGRYFPISGQIAGCIIPAGT